VTSTTGNKDSKWPSAIAVSITLAGVLVSAASVATAHLQKQRELIAQREESLRRVAAEDREYTYKWKLDLMQFIERHANDVFSDDPVKLGRMQQIMVAAFPPEEVKELFLRIQETSVSPAAKESWRKAGGTARSVSARQRLAGFAYVGQWTKGQWLTRYFDPVSGKQLPTPSSLEGVRLRVRRETGALNLRSDVPDASGNNRPAKGVLREGDEVVVDEAPLFNDGEGDSGYIWARVSPGG
jgi:hypothetical protein